MASRAVSWARASSPEAGGSLRRTDSALTGGSDVENGAVVVGAAVGAGLVLELLLAAATARDQRGRGGLPLRPSRSGVAARHLPLGNGHGYLSSVVSFVSCASACKAAHRASTRSEERRVGKEGRSR